MNRTQVKAAPRVAAPTSLPRERAGFVALALFVLTLLLFSRVVGPGFEFVNYDDPDYVTKNGHVQGGLTAEGVRWALGAGVASNWHPLTWMSHMLDWSWWGDNPRAHHATNILLHGFNAVLAFLAFRRLTGAFWASAVCAALFAWHPLRVESVAWIAERKDVLSGVFWFVAVWAYAGYVQRRTENPRAAYRWYGVTLVAFALGLMAKPMLVTLPCVLLLLDVWPLRRWPTGEATRSAASARPLTWLILEKLPFFALSAASSLITYHVQKAGGSVTEALGFGARFANAFVAVVRYVGKFLVPFDLAVLYPHPGHWAEAKVAAAVAIVLGITALVVAQFRRRPWLAVGWLWFLGTLVPVVGIVQVGMQSMADRYTYLPILGVQLMLVWTAREFILTPGSRRLATLVVAGVLLAGAARTWNQLGVWRNSETLFSHAIDVTTDNFVAYDNRGLYRYEHGRAEEAIADYRRALAINPRYMNANNNLGHALAELGRPAEALPFYRAALEAAPNQVEVRNNLANALSDVGQLDEAMQHYDFVLARQPDHANALNGSAVVRAMQGKPAEAKQRLEHALRVAPRNAGAENNLGNVCSMLGQLDEAMAHYRRATELNPREVHAFVLIGNLLNQQQKFAEAAENFRRALAGAPNNADAHAQLGLALARLGRRAEALTELRTAVQLKPDYAEAKTWLQAIEQAK